MYLIPEGRQIAKHRKMHLFDIQVHGGQHFRESDVLSAGNSVTVFDTSFGTFGLAVCFDIRFSRSSSALWLSKAPGSSWFRQLLT